MKYILVIGIAILNLSPLFASPLRQECDPVDLLLYMERSLAGLGNAVRANVGEQILLTEIQTFDDTVRTYHAVCHDGPSAASSPTPAFSGTGQTVYVVGSSGINVRAEASTSARILGSVPAGGSAQSYGTVDGQVFSGSIRWHRIDYNGQSGFVHTTLVSTSRPSRPSNPAPASVNAPAQPAPPAQPIVQPTQPPPPAPAAIRPDNCDHAVAMGLSPQQAAQWPHLDRDKDGVACYGD